MNYFFYHEVDILCTTRHTDSSAEAQGAMTSTLSAVFDPFGGQTVLVIGDLFQFM